jgi:hypothetical protein
MRTMLFASAAILALASALPALAQTVPQTVTGARPGNVIGTDSSLPTSNNASNINRTDTRSPIAPRLPAPGLAEGSTPSQFLNAAKGALRTNRTGEAQEAIERAETRLLDRSTAQGADPLSTSPLVAQLGQARGALAAGDRARAMQIIDTVLASMGAATGSTL